ncbi:MAG: hypothetical protein ACRD0Z_04530 [Acidimicrobiales bacterium]
MTVEDSQDQPAGPPAGEPPAEFLPRAVLVGDSPPVSGPPAGRLRRFAPPAICVAIYCVLAAFAYGVHPPATSITLPPCACGDVTSQLWFAAWPAHAIAHGLNPFYTSVADYPHGVNLMTNTGAPLLGILFAPVTWILGPVSAFSLIMRSALALSGISMCFVLRRWTKWWPAAFVGGLLYAFSPFMVGQSQSHDFLTFVPLPPLMLALIDAIVVRRHRPLRNGVILGVVLAAQLMISPEVLAMCITATVGALVVMAIRHPVAAWERVRDLALGVVGAAVAFLVLGAYPMWVYLRGPYRVAGPPHPLDELEAYHSSPLSLIYPTTLQRLRLGSWTTKGMLLLQGNGVEHTTYVGVALLAVLAFLLVRGRKIGVIPLFSLVAVVAWAVTFGHAKNHFLPYHFLLKIPLANGGLDLRYSLLMYFDIAVVLAVGLDLVHREGFWPHAAAHASANPGVKWVRIGGPALLAIVGLIPLVPALPYQSTPVGVPVVFTAANSPITTGEAVLLSPVPLNYEGPNDEALLWQAIANMRFKIVGFRGAIANAEHEPLRGANTLLAPKQAEDVLEWGVYGEPSPPPPMGAATTAAIRQFLSHYGIGAVVVAYPGTRGAAVAAYFQAALGKPPVDFGGSDVWPDVQSDLG